MKTAKESNLNDLLSRLKQSNFNAKKKQLQVETDEATVKEQESRLPKTAKNISKDIQDATDEYLNTWIEMKELEKRTRELRKVIEPYMNSREINYIEGTQGGAIEIKSQNRVEITSRYTTYDISEVREQFSSNLFREMVVEVVDAKKLESIVHLSDSVPDSMIEDLKVRMSTNTFTVQRP